MNAIEAYRTFTDTGDTIRYTKYHFNDDGTTTDEPPQEIKHAPLLCCPLCGAKAEFKSIAVPSLTGAAIRCTKCGVRIGMLEGLNVMTKKYITLPEIIHKLTEQWNRRHCATE